MTTAAFGEVQRWLLEQKARLDAAGFSLTFAENWANSQGEGTWVDVEGDLVCGRITINWNGAVDWVMIEVSTEETLGFETIPSIETIVLAAWFEALMAANREGRMA